MSATVLKKMMNGSEELHSASSEVFKNMEKPDPLVIKMQNLDTTGSQIKQNYTDRSTLVKNHKNLAGCFQVISYSSAMKNPAGDSIFQSHSQMDKITFKSLNLYHRVTISDLLKSINQALFGKIFVCRTIALPFIYENKFQTVIEEPVEESMQSAGCLIMVAALHLDPKGKTSEEFMSVGTMLLIQDPLLVESSLGGVALCVHPKNFFILSNKLWKKLFSRKLNWPKVLESPEQKLVELQQLGNKAFTERRFDDAIEHYTIGVKIDPSNTNLRSNLVACFLNIRCYSRALHEADNVLGMDGNHEKCIYRKVKALWGCLRYEEALEFLRKTINSNPGLSKNVSITSLLSTGEKILRQSQTGKDYEFLKYFSEDLKPLGLDVGEYQGNIKVNFPRGSRPFVTATANILPGQLLVCSKAFATHFSKGDNIDKRKYYELLTLTLAKNVFQKISLEPNHERELFKLPRLPSDIKRHAAPEVKMERVITVVKANQIVTLGNSNSLPGTMENSSDLLYRILNSECCVGIWVLPSCFESKCIDHNASTEIMGDVKFIRAIKAIPKGERIFVSQFNIVESYFDRKAVEKEVQLSCYCRFCTLEALDPEDVHQARFDMMQLMNIRLLQPKDGALGNSENDYTAYLVKCISKLRSFRQKDAELNVHVILPIHYLAKLFFSNKDYTYSITLWKEAYGLAVTASQGRFIVCFCASIVDSYFLLRCFNEATYWMNELRKQLMTFYGCVDVLEFFEPDTLVKVQSLVDLF